MIEQIKTKIQEIIENHRNLQKNVKSFNPDLAMGLQALIDEDMEILSIIESLQKVQTSRLWHDSNKEQPKQGSDVVIVNGRTGSILSYIVEVSPNRIWAYLDDLLKLEEISPKLPLISSKEELKQKPFKVEKGKWYVCIKDYHDKNCTFTKGKNYKSDKDGFIIDDEDKDTFERKIWEEDACEYFRPIKCMYTKAHYTDEDRKVLCDGCDEDCEFSQKKKPVSNVLDEELDRFKKLHGPMATLERCAKHFAYWQKQMMIKDAVDGVVHHFDGDNLASIHYNDPKGVPMCYYASAIGLESGDKVKIIIIKDES